MSELKTHSVHNGVKWPCVWSRDQRLKLARAVLEDEFKELREDSFMLGHGVCDVNMRAIAYVLIRQLADDSNISPNDCARLHKAAAILRGYKP